MTDAYIFNQLLLRIFLPLLMAIILAGALVLAGEGKK